MSRTEGTPARRRRARPVADVPDLTPVMLPAAPADRPRVPELDALLQEVDRLRRTLETDLALAAAATEAGEAQLAADILDADREALRNFEAQTLGRLEALAEQDQRPAVSLLHRAWVPARAASFVAAAALVGLLAGVVPQAISRHPQDGAPGQLAASESLQRLQELVLSGDPSEIRAASAELHEQLASFVAVARTDPAAAQNALMLLSYEQSVISHSADRTQLADVLRQSQALARAIRAALPASVRSGLPKPPKVPAYDQPQPRTSPHGVSSPKPSPTPSVRSSSTTSPSAQPSPSPSQSNPYQLPTQPFAP